MILVELVLLLLFLLGVSFVLRGVVWRISPLFFALNWAQWFLYNPLRYLYRNRASHFPRRLHQLLLYSGIGPLYGLTVHLLLTPLRLINAIYFNAVLSWSLILHDGLAEVFHPKLGKYRYLNGWRYRMAWITGFPWRLGVFLARNLVAVVEGFLLTGFDTVWPTLTMYHGTHFEGSATDIAQKGRWLVGPGDYAGSGVYFGLHKRVAEHYAGGHPKEAQAIVLSRVTLTLNRNVATLPPTTRNKVGRDGQGISGSLRFPCYSTEHWRTHPGWFEYCLVQPGRAGEYVQTWRARPIAVLKDGVPTRIWGGRSFYPGLTGVGIIVTTWGIIIAATVAG